MTIPLKNWLLGAALIFGTSFAADFFFIHYLFPNKREAQIEKYNEGVVEYLNKNCEDEKSPQGGLSSGDATTSGSEKLEQCTPTQKATEENRSESP